MSYRRRATLLASAVVTTVACGSSTASQPHQDRIVATAAGSCVVVYASDCPEGKPCPAETYGKESIACPPSLTNGGGSMRLWHHEGRCNAFFEMECPKDATCNPPPPEDIDCPERYRPPPPQPVADPTRIVRRPDGICYEHRETKCPEGARCNPPPPRKVPCPPEAPEEPATRGPAPSDTPE